MRKIADEWHAQDNMYLDCIEIMALNRRGDMREYVAAELTVHRVEAMKLYDGGPTLQIGRDDAQQLMNELWRIGLRPRDGAGSLAHVDAQRAHLDDMRRLVFKEP